MSQGAYEVIKWRSGEGVKAKVIFDLGINTMTMRLIKYKFLNCYQEMISTLLKICGKLRLVA